VGLFEKLHTPRAYHDGKARNILDARHPRAKARWFFGG